MALIMQLHCKTSWQHVHHHLPMVLQIHTTHQASVAVTPHLQDTIWYMQSKTDR